MSTVGRVYETTPCFTQDENSRKKGERRTFPNECFVTNHSFSSSCFFFFNFHLFKIQATVDTAACFQLQIKPTNHTDAVAKDIRIKFTGKYSLLVNIFSSPMAPQPLLGQGFLIIEASRWHSDSPQLVRLLWTSNQPEAETT